MCFGNFLDCFEEIGPTYYEFGSARQPRELHWSWVIGLSIRLAVQHDPGSSHLPMYITPVALVWYCAPYLEVANQPLWEGINRVLYYLINSTSITSSFLHQISLEYFNPRTTTTTYNNISPNQQDVYLGPLSLCQPRSWQHPISLPSTFRDPTARSSPNPEDRPRSPLPLSRSLHTPRRTLDLRLSAYAWAEGGWYAWREPA